MRHRVRRFLIQAGIVVLALVLLYLAFPGKEDFGKIREALGAANYVWLVPLTIITLASHVLRAWRWQVLLEALPSVEAAPRRISLKTAFYSLMIGYMVNYAVPRMGEVVRTANLAAKEKLPFSGVLGTVVIERILDAVVLLLGLIATFFLLFDQLGLVREALFAPLQDRMGTATLLLAPAALVALTVLVLVVYWRALRSEDSRVRRFWDRRLRPLLAAFKDGLATLWRSPQRAALVVSTLAIWFCYLQMAYVPFLMFDMAAPFGLSMLDAVTILFLGSLGVALPSPGGLGTYHVITINALVFLFAVDAPIAQTYAFFVHGGQLVLYVALGFLSILLQGTSFAALRRTTQAARQTPDDDDAPPPPAEIRHDQTPEQR